MLPLWMKSPSAFIPVAMSLFAVALVLIHAAIVPFVKHPGNAAINLLVQILLAAQLPVIVFVIVTRLRRDPKPTLRILAVQAAAAFAAIVADWIFT